MRKISLSLLLMVLAGCSSSPPGLKDIAPPLAGNKPVIDQVTYRTAQDQHLTVYSELHFRAPEGNVVAIHREIISNDSPMMPVSFLSDSRVDISPEQQKRGAIYVGDWKCGPERYRVQLRAYLIDSNHNHSNAVDYSIDCAN